MFTSANIHYFSDLPITFPHIFNIYYANTHRQSPFTAKADSPSVGYPLVWLLSLYKLEQVRMRASSQEEQRQFSVVLLPRHQPVWLDVALPGLNALVN